MGSRDPGHAVLIEERPDPPRTRRTSDLVRLALTGAAAALVVAAGSFSLGTTTGLQEDITTAVTTLPNLIVRVLATLSGLIVLALPLYLVADLALRRRWRLLGTSLAAAAIGFLVAEVFSAQAAHLVSDQLYESLTRPIGGGERTAAAFGLFAGVVALVTVEGLAGRPRSNLVVWASLLALAALWIIDRRATLLALLLSVLAGHAVGLTVRYLSGTENPRVPSTQVAAALERVGVRGRRLYRLDEDSERGRRYELERDDGSLARVQVLDPDRTTSQLLANLVRNLRVRTWVTGTTRVSERGAVQQAAVPVLMAERVGVRTPRLLAAAEVDPRTALYVLEEPFGLRRLAGLAPDDVDDEMLDESWRALRRLHHAGIAHQGMHPGALAADHDGRMWLLDLTEGEIAASRLRMRLDRAELLISTAVLVGTVRALDAAARVIGEEDLAMLPGLFQPVALNREIRVALKEHGGLLDQLRDAVAARSPGSVPTEEVRIERLRPRSIVSWVAATFAVYVLAGQLSDVDFGTVVNGVDWWLAAASLAASLLTYVGSALTISPFSPVRVPMGRWLLAQFASTFVTLVAPAAVGHAGTNTRVIQRAGVAAPLALASVGVSTAVSVVTTLVLFVGMGLISQADPGFQVSLPSGGLLAVVGVVLAVIGITLAVPAGRRAIVERARPLWENTGPGLLDVLRNPWRLAEGVGGNLLTTLAYAATLHFAVLAYGGELSFVASAVVYLGAGLIGTVAPTPGGIGAVEAALVAGLGAVGVPASLGLPAALLYRIVTFWLPAVVGWWAFQRLQRSEAI